MRKLIGSIVLAVVVGLAGMTAVPTGAGAASCTPTGFYRDGFNLTAAIINPAGTLSGEVDATGCNIGVYYGPGSTGSVSGANVHGANYYGIVNNEGAVNVSDSQVHDIGEVPLNGSQHGVGVYLANVLVGPPAPDHQPACDLTGPTTSGTISGNTISLYQKGGIVANCTGTSVTVNGNTVTGQGPVDYIAQNGIQLSRGATGSVTRNTVSGNQYSGSNFASSAGILLYGGCGDALTTGVMINNNVVQDNDVGLYMFNADASCSLAPSTKTNNNAVNNTISDSDTTNYNGWDGHACGYQAGISDSGNHDNMTNNRISGSGYAVSGSTTTGCTVGEQTVPLVSLPIDTSFASADARLHHNALPN